MDQELTAYLDRRFGDLDGKIGDLDGKIGVLGFKIGDLDGRVGDLDRRTERRFKELREHVDTQIRETQIMIEGLRSSQETLAESIVDMNARYDRTREENERERQKNLAFCTSLFSDVKGRVDDHEERIGDCEARVRRIESGGG